MSNQNSKWIINGLKGNIKNLEKLLEHFDKPATEFSIQTVKEKIEIQIIDLNTLVNEIEREENNNEQTN